MLPYVKLNILTRAQDIVKVRIQLAAAEGGNTSVAHVAQTLLRQDGPAGFWALVKEFNIGIYKGSFKGSIRAAF